LTQTCVATICYAFSSNRAFVPTDRPVSPNPTGLKLDASALGYHYEKRLQAGQGPRPASTHREGFEPPSHSSRLAPSVYTSCLDRLGRRLPLPHRRIPGKECCVQVGSCASIQSMAVSYWWRVQGRLRGVVGYERYGYNRNLC
jgi:hypothetical protein